MVRLNLGLLDSVLLNTDSSLPGWAELGQAKWVGGLGEGIWRGQPSDFTAEGKSGVLVPFASSEWQQLGTWPVAVA